MIQIIELGSVRLWEVNTRVDANLGPLQPACEGHYPAAAHPGLEEARHGGPSPESRAP